MFAAMMQDPASWVDRRSISLTTGTNMMGYPPTQPIQPELGVA
jgi:hypothetical protein